MIDYFSQDFLKISSNDISKQISENSFFSAKSAIDPEIINKIFLESDLFNIKLNSLEISSVHDQDGYYMSNGLAKSRTLYNFLTSNKIIEISKAYLGDKFRLKCHRVYSVGSGAKNPWHTDDKKYGKKNEYSKGIVFIVYLNDVFDGEFQLIKGSHLFSSSFKYPNFDEHIIDEKYKKEIKSFKMPSGSIIMFDNKTIHRAKPYLDFFWRRKSLFFQIDNDVNDGEKILINSEFIEDLNTDKIMLLGMGKPAKMPHEPSSTGIHSINFRLIFIIQLNLFKAIYKRVYYNLKFFLSDKIKRNLQNIFGKKINVNTKK